MERVIRRFFGKKRGNRNMRSDSVGGAWWAIFSALFLAGGCAMLVYLLSRVMIPEWRANHDYHFTTAVVLDKRLQQRTTEEGDQVYRPELLVKFAVKDLPYETWAYDAARLFTNNRKHCLAILSRFEVQREYPCWYDPLDPTQVVLVQGFSWPLWLFLVLPVPFIAIGGGGLVYSWLNWGKSEEHRASTTRRTNRLPLASESAAMQQRYPYIPTADGLTDSAGTTLAYRLPSEPTNWSLYGLMVVAVISFAVTAAMITHHLHRTVTTGPDWSFWIAASAPTIIGLALLTLTVRRLLVNTGIGPTLIEIDHHPLRPGERYDLFISQPGRLKLKCLRIALECEEEAHFVQGTNLSVDTRCVHRAELFARESFEILPVAPLEIRTSFEIPASAMHSFEGEHNKINWRLTVAGELVHLPPFRRTYALIVHPPRGAEELT